MNLYKTKGAYIHISDFRKEGFLTIDKKGNYKTRKYGFLDKLDDMIDGRKNLHLNFHFMVFYLSIVDKKTTLYYGSYTATDLESLLKGFNEDQSFRNSTKVHFIEEGNYIRLPSKFDAKLSFSQNGTQLLRSFFNDLINEQVEMEYKFYPFTAEQWEWQG